MSFKLPENTPTEISEIFDKPEVREIVDKLASKNKDLLNQLSLQKKEVNDLGGIETIKQKLGTLDQLESEKAQNANKAGIESSDVAQVRQAFQEQLDAANQKLKKAEEARVANTVKAKLAKAIKDLGGDPELLEPFITQRIKSKVGDDGEVQIEVFASNGGPLVTEKGDGTLNDLVNEFKHNARYGVMFQAENVGGSGAKPTGTAVATENPFQKGTPHFDPAKQGELFRTDPAKAKALAAQAGFKLFNA